jgi:hypothetical protein
MAGLTRDKRKRIEGIVLDVMTKLDRSGSNTERYKKMMGEMSDSQFETWVKQFATDEDQHFYLAVLPYKNEPTLDDVEAAAKVTGTQLHQYVYFRHDGAKDNPVRTAVKVPVGLTAH